MTAIVKKMLVPEKTLGCRAADEVHTEINGLIDLKSQRSGKKATRTEILLLALEYGLPLVRRHIEAGMNNVSHKGERSEPEQMAEVAAALVRRGWQSLQEDLAALPAPAP